MTERSISASRDHAAIRLEQVVKAKPSGFQTMRGEALAEGYRFLERLAADWDFGALRFTRPGEMLLAAYSDGVLAGIGGLTVDPVLSKALRMRRFYIRKAFRRHGIGQRLAAALLEPVLARGCPVTVNAAAGSAGFWDSLGFVPDKRDGHTHLLRVSPGSIKL
jgi:GNAT superfamily N-acetyltransferase